MSFVRLTCPEKFMEIPFNNNKFEILLIAACGPRGYCYSIYESYPRVHKVKEIGKSTGNYSFPEKFDDIEDIVSHIDAFKNIIIFGIRIRNQKEENKYKKYGFIDHLSNHI